MLLQRIYDGIRTRSLAIRSRTPYPLGHIDIFYLPHPQPDLGAVTILMTGFLSGFDLLILHGLIPTNCNILYYSILCIGICTFFSSLK